MAQVESKSGPRCPKCNVEGEEYIDSIDSNNETQFDYEVKFIVVYCNQCGHVYGPIVKQVFSQKMNFPTGYLQR